MAFLLQTASKTCRSLLERYVAKNPLIRNSYLRHGASLTGHNPLFSDWDLCFFVQSENSDEFFRNAGEIEQAFSSLPLKWLKTDVLILPETPFVQEFCERYYESRAHFPKSTWIEFSESPRDCRYLVKHTVPLDQVPECSLHTFFIPTLKGRLKQPLKFIVKRRLESDFMRAQRFDLDRPVGFEESLKTNLKIWSEFFERIEDFSPSDSESLVEGKRNPPKDHFLALWREIPNPKTFDGLTSIWLYPKSTWFEKPVIILNVDLEADSKTVVKSLKTYLQQLEGIKYELEIGSEKAMIGRLNFLSRDCHLDPILFKYYGHCRFGNPNVAHGVQIPSRSILDAKYKEFLLRTAFKAHRKENRLGHFRLGLMMDQVLKKRTLLMDDDELFSFYPSRWNSVREERGSKQRKVYFEMLEKLHGFTPWSNETKSS